MAENSAKDYKKYKHYHKFTLAEEDIDYDTKIIMFTLSPNPQRKGRGGAVDQKQLYISDIDKVFSHFHTCMSAYVVSPELNQTGNIHYHGWFQIKDKYKFYKHVINRLHKLGFVKLTKVKYLDKDWSGYCQKDYELMKAVMYPWPIPLTHLTYKNIKHLISYTKLEALKQKDEKSLSKSILSYIK